MWMDEHLFNSCLWFSRGIGKLVILSQKDLVIAGTKISSGTLVLAISIGIWLVVWLPCFIFPEILGISSSQLTNSYFSEGFFNHQPVVFCVSYV